MPCVYGMKARKILLHHDFFGILLLQCYFEIQSSCKNYSLTFQIFQILVTTDLKTSMQTLIKYKSPKTRNYLLVIIKFFYRLTSY